MLYLDTDIYIVNPKKFIKFLSNKDILSSGSLSILYNGKNNTSFFKSLLKRYETSEIFMDDYVSKVFSKICYSEIMDYAYHLFVFDNYNYKFKFFKNGNEINNYNDSGTIYLNISKKDNLYIYRKLYTFNPNFLSSEDKNFLDGLVNNSNTIDSIVYFACDEIQKYIDLLKDNNIKIKNDGNFIRFYSEEKLASRVRL